MGICYANHLPPSHIFCANQISWGGQERPPLAGGILNYHHHHYSNLVKCYFQKAAMFSVGAHRVTEEKRMTINERLGAASTLLTPIHFWNVLSFLRSEIFDPFCQIQQQQEISKSLLSNANIVIFGSCVPFSLSISLIELYFNPQNTGVSGII